MELCCIIYINSCLTPDIYTKVLGVYNGFSCLRCGNCTIVNDRLYIVFPYCFLCCDFLTFLCSTQCDVIVITVCCNRQVSRYIERRSKEIFLCVTNCICTITTCIIRCSIHADVTVDGIQERIASGVCG